MNPKGPGKEQLTSLLEKNPNDFFANLALGTLLRKEKSNGPAEVYLKKAQKLFPEFVEPDNPYQILAEIYLEEKREDEALTELLGWSRFDENSAWPLCGRPRSIETARTGRARLAFSSFRSISIPTTLRSTACWAKLRSKPGTGPRPSRRTRFS